MIENSKDKRININDNCFDIIQLLCTFTVFFGHFLTHFEVIDKLLHGIAYFIRGVPVFFLLSGLFIARSLERYSTKEFLARRIIRIYPELWACVIINLAIILLSLRTKYSLKDILIYLATQMTVFQFYTGDWLRVYGVGTPNGALWTITVDIQFYIVAIFLVKWMKRRSIRTWSIIIFLTMALDLVLEKTKDLYPEIVYKLLQCNLLPFLWIFLVGMCVYYNRDKLIPVTIKEKWVLFAAYLLWQYLIPNSVVSLFEGIRYNLITTLLLLFMIVGFGFSFRKRWKHDYSYSFYLYHMVVINFIINNICKSFSSSGQFTATLFGSVLVIGAFAILSHKYCGEELSRRIKKLFIKN